MSDVEAALKDAKRDDVDEVRMSFGEHLEELRVRLIACVLTWLVCFLVAMYFYKPLLTFVCEPHFRAMEWMGRTRETSKLFTGAYAGSVWAVMKLAFIVSVFAASPIIAWQIWRFVAAGLYRHERKYVLVYALPSLLLFIGGSVFGYLVLVPYGLFGMASMLKMDVVTEQYQLRDYLDLVMALTIFTGLIFELPLIMMFTSSIGLTGPNFFWKYSRHAIVALFLLAAVLTPSPDIFTQCLMAGPLLVLYLLGVLLSYAVQKKPVAA